MTAIQQQTAEEIERAQWAKARTLADLADLTAAWLEGAIGYQPGYYGGPADETKPLIPYLAAMNRAGFLTESSQPATAVRRGDELDQCAYVSGFATADAAAKIKQAAFAQGWIVIASQLWNGNTTQVAVTRDPELGYVTFAGTLPADYIDEYYAEDCPNVLDALRSAWQVAVINPHWGYNHCMFGVLRDALTAA